MQSPVNLRLLARAGLFVVYTLALFAVSLTDRLDPPTLPSWLDHADKAVHLAMYAGYAMIILWTWGGSLRGHAVLPAVILYCALIGGLIEVLQHTLTQTRSFSWGDIVFNVAGATLGAGWIRHWTLARNLRPTGEKASDDRA